MLLLSFSIIILAAIQPKSNAASNLQKLCQGQQFGSAVPNPHDCTSFYVCQFVIQLTQCPVGLQYDRRKKVCNWPKDAGCDWVEPEAPDTSEEMYPERPEVKPNQPGSDHDQTLPGSEGSGQPNQDGNGAEIPKSSDEDNDDRPPSEDKIPGGGETSQESEESKPVTNNDTATKEPEKPDLVDPNNSSEEDHDNGSNPGEPTVGDMITDEPWTPRPSSAENQDKPPDSPSTVDDMVTNTKTPPVNSGEAVDPTPALPKPAHPEQPPTPPNSEGTDQQPSGGNQSSSENENPESQTDDNITKPDADLPTSSNHSSHHWNLIASIVSVESSHTGGFINHPTVGAHNPETGYPVDVMTGYDPKKVQCLHSGLYFLPHPTSCQKYFICAYRHLHLHSCGNGVIWNHKREQCDVGSNSRCYARDAESEDNTSTSELVTPFIEDQTRKTTKRVVRPSTRKPMSKTTKLPATATATTITSHKLPECPPNRQIYLPNSEDCHRYYICIMGKPVLTSCPNGMHWDAVEEVCDKPSVARCARRHK